CRSRGAARRGGDGLRGVRIGLGHGGGAGAATGDERGRGERADIQGRTHDGPYAARRAWVSRRADYPPRAMTMRREAARAACIVQCGGGTRTPPRERRGRTRGSLFFLEDAMAIARMLLVRCLGLVPLAIVAACSSST